MKTKTSLIIVLAALAISALAQASDRSKGIFTLIPAAGTDSSALNQALKHPALRSHAALFTPSERAALEKLGEKALAASMQVRFFNESDFREFSEFVSRKSLKLKLEPVELPVALTAAPEPLSREQWGLRNDGSSLTIPIDDITSTTLPGRAGEDIGVELAPAEKADALAVTVAVLDTGIDATHPDLAPNFLRKDEECKALDSYRECLKGSDKKACDTKWAAFDSDGNGYPMDCQGWNLTVGKNPLNGIQGNSQTADTVGHGTHVAGVIGAALNGQGIRGVSQKVRLLPVKIYNGNPRSPVRAQSLNADSEPLPEPSENGRNWDTGFADVIARGVLYAIRSGAQVMNISLAWPVSADSELMRRMVRLAQDRGILIVAAAGNDSTEAEVMPCAYNGVVCVASHQPDGSLSHFSNHGASVDVAAPGVRILSTWPLSLRPSVFTDLNGYDFKNGTSMAAPFATGALARLIAYGFTPAEAYARILAGARFAGNKDATRSVRFGNIDLRASHELKAEPLILPARKEMLEVSWDRQSRRLVPSFELKNVWASARNVEISARLGSEAADSLELETNRVILQDWDSGTTRLLTMPIRVVRDDFPSEVDVWLDVSAHTRANSLLRSTRSFKVRLAVSVAIERRSTDSEFLSIPLTDAPSAQVKVRSVIPTGTSPSSSVMLDYALVSRTGSDRAVTIVSRTFENGKEAGPYSVQGTLTLKAADGELLAMYRLDWDLDGRDEYALVTSIPSAPGKADSKFRFVYLGRGENEGTLKILAAYYYQPTKAVIPEGFAWMRVGNRLAPAWVGGGFTPEGETPAYDPWNPEWTDSPNSRFYYIGESGLRTITAPDSYTFVSALGQTESQKSAGILPVLLAKGDSYRLEYATAAVLTKARATQPELTELSSLRLPNFRMLLGYDSALPVWSLERGAEAPGSAFSLSGRPGTLRTTILEYSQTNSKSQSGMPEIANMVDLLSTPFFESDAVVRTAAVFAGKGGGVFTQTQFDLQFQDLKNQKTVLSSLRRFSFLPQLSFLRGFLPAVVHSRDETSSETAPGRRPAILIEGSPTGKDISETIFPEYAPNGTLTKLVQPARLRLAAGASCQRVPNPISPSATAASQVAFFCGDRFIRVPLTR